MKRSDIKRAYRYIHPAEDVKERMLDNILSAASDTTPGGKELYMKRTKWKKAWLIAAVLGVMVFLMGCAVVVFTLKDMQIGEYTNVVERYIDEDGSKIRNYEITKDVISLQGIKGSPSQMAAQEWHEFESIYDLDHKLLDEADRNPIEVSREYDAYFVYTYDMVDKVDEIAEKYGLKLAGPVAVVQRENPEIFYESLGISGFVRDEAGAELEFWCGYFYACGNFNAEFDLLLTAPDAWEHKINGSMRYCGKDYLDTVFAHISAVENFTQWTYRLADGEEVLIVTGDEHALILCDREDAFISVALQTMHCDENNVLTNMSKRDIELAADAIDFTITTQKPDMAEANRRIQQAYEKEQTEADARMDEYEDPFKPKDSFAQKIQKVIENGASPDNYYYALYDVNADGIDDLLLGNGEESFGPIYTVHQGQTYMLLSFGMDKYSYLCENGIIMHNDKEGNPNGYYFYKIGEITGDGLEASMIDAVSYDDWDECWKRSLGGYYGTDVKITEEEAMKVIESYGRVNLEMKAIREYPMG